MAKEHISFHFEPGSNTFTYNAPKSCSSERTGKALLEKTEIKIDRTALYSSDRMR